MVIRELRACQGRNIYCHRPVLVMQLDLGSEARRPTNKISGFVQGVLALLPGLHDHRCSRGKPGGLVERLEEGTYLGHVVEHVWLELMNLAGEEASYGKTFSTSNPLVYEVVCEYRLEGPARLAGQQAVELVNALLSGRGYDVARASQQLKALASQTELGPSTRAIVEACRNRKIPVLRLNDGSLLQLGYGAKLQRVQATLTQQASCVATDIASDKVLTKDLLDQLGIPVPRGAVVQSEHEAAAAAHHLGPAVVVKPRDANQGKGVTLNLRTAGEIKGAYQLARAFSEEVIVEKHVPGRQYRVLVVGNKVVAASERLPACVTGDGIHTVAQLLDMENQNPLRGEDHGKPLTRLKLDEAALLALKKQGSGPESCPAAGEMVLLRENANLSTGGTAVDVTDSIHPENADLAVEAARIVGLDVAGVDIVTPDIRKPLVLTGGAVIEVNASPGIRMHHYPAAGKPRDAAGAIVDLLFPQAGSARIPIVTVTGTNGKTTTTRLISHILRQRGAVVGMTTTDGIYVGDRCVRRGDTTGPLSARQVLMDSRTEIAVLETARGGLIRGGLAFDWADVAVVTNISDDHLGQHGIETLEDLAFVKSLVVEAVHPAGFAVLNADDALVARMHEHARCQVIYFSTRAGNPLIKRHLGAGGMAAFVLMGTMVLAKGDCLYRLIKVNRVPITWNGSAVHNIQNALAAIGGATALGVPPQLIISGLQTFGLQPADNPGRLLVREIDGVKVVVDFGHNPAGFASLLKTVKSWRPGRIIGVIGVPGDRPDRSIKKCGRVAGQMCDRVLIKEDLDLRGRKPGETAKLLQEGASAAGLERDRISLESSETTALEQALSQGRPGDIIVIFYESLQAVLAVLDQASDCKNRRKGDQPLDAVAAVAE